MRIIMGADHGGADLKNALMERLEAAGHQVKNLGVDAQTRIDYPDKAQEVCAAYMEGGYDLAILVCGTGIGISIAANKCPGIRAALLTDCFSARMAKEHNDANVLCFGGRTLGVEHAWAMLEAYLAADFAGAHHRARVDKLTALD